MAKKVSGLEQLGPDKWRLRLYLGKKPKLDKNGKPVVGANGKPVLIQNKPSRVFYGTKTEAKKELARWQTEANSGIRVDAAKITVEEFCWRYHENRVVHGSSKARGGGGPLSKRTLAGEAVIIRKICTYFGDFALGELNADMVQAGYTAMRESGYVTQNGLWKLHKVFRKILQTAVHKHILIWNPAAEFDAPQSGGTEERSHLSEFSARRLLSIVNSSAPDSNLVAVRLAITLGMRKGEILGLVWSNVHLDDGIIEVCQQWTADREITECKTRNSMRVIELGESTIEYLRKWKATQRGQLEAAGVIDVEAMGRAQVATILRSTPVCSNAVGEFMDHGNFARWFKKFCARHNFGAFYDDDGNVINMSDGMSGNGTDSSGVPYSRSNKKWKGRKRYSGLRFHELRHTFATIAIANNVPVADVSAILGHYDPSVTNRVYNHSEPERRREGIQKVENIMESKSEQAAV